MLDFGFWIWILTHLVKHDDQEVGVRAREHRDVHGDGGRVGFVQPDAKVPLAAEEEQDEDSDVDESNSTLICPGVIQMV